MLATRPPLDDAKGDAKKKIDVSNSPLEGVVHAALRRVLAYCDRRFLVFQDGLVADHSGSFCFKSPSHFGATLDNDERRTLGVALLIPRIVEAGPGLLTVFGMGGIETAAWCYLLSQPGLRDEVVKLIESASAPTGRLAVLRIPEVTGDGYPGSFAFLNGAEISSWYDVAVPP